MHGAKLAAVAAVIGVVCGGAWAQTPGHATGAGIKITPLGQSADSADSNSLAPGALPGVVTPPLVSITQTTALLALGQAGAVRINTIPAGNPVLVYRCVEGTRFRHREGWCEVAYGNAQFGWVNQAHLDAGELAAGSGAMEAMAAQMAARQPGQR